MRENKGDIVDGRDIAINTPIFSAGINHEVSICALARAAVLATYPYLPSQLE
jgi:hypothetical protein